MNDSSEFKGHSRKVILAKWHPSAEQTFASASTDGCVKIWNVNYEQAVFSN